MCKDKVRVFNGIFCAFNDLRSKRISVTFHLAEGFLNLKLSKHISCCMLSLITKRINLGTEVTK